MIYLAVFASGAGSNAQKIIEHFNKDETLAKVSLVVCNKKNAGVLQVAAAAGVPTLIIEKERFAAGDGYTAVLRGSGIDFIVLAGFLWKVPDALVEAYPRPL